MKARQKLQEKPGAMDTFFFFNALYLTADIKVQI